MSGRWLAFILLSLVGSFASAQGLPAPDQPSKAKAKEGEIEYFTGLASWYGPECQGQTTANGERYDKDGLTAAHKTLPFGTLLLVESLDTGASVVVRVNDRGPSVPGRIIDLSEAAARILGMLGSGTSHVRFRAIAAEEAASFGVPRPTAPTAARDAAGSAAGAATAPTSRLCRIQVAAYRDARNAEAALTRLKLSGLTATVETSGSIRRVVFSAVPAADAEALAERLRGLGYIDLVLTWY